MERRRPGRSARLLLAVAAAAVVASACTDSGSPSPPPAGSSSPSSPPSPSDPYQQDFTNGEPCPVSPAGALPPGSGCVSSAKGDLDGDGRPDRFVVFATMASDGRPVSWHAIALLASGPPVAPIALPTGAQVEGQSSVYPKVVGAFDADRDGRAEVFLKLTGIVYHIAVAHIAGIFHLVDGSIQQVAVRAQGPWHFFTGGTSRRGQGVVCATVDARPALLVRLIQVVPPERWSWTEQTYFWRDGILEPGPTRHGFYPQSVSIADPRVVAFYALRCGPVFLE